MQRRYPPDTSTGGDETVLGDEKLYILAIDEREAAPRFFDRPVHDDPNEPLFPDDDGDAYSAPGFASGRVFCAE